MPLKRFAVLSPAPPPAAACPLPAVADPFLLQRDGKLFMFYETKSAEQQKGQIGVAASEDGGRSFRHLAVVLDLPWHLSYPFVFEHEGQVGRAAAAAALGNCAGAGVPGLQSACSCSALLPTPATTTTTTTMHAAVAATSVLPCCRCTCSPRAACLGC